MKKISYFITLICISLLSCNTKDQNKLNSNTDNLSKIEQKMEKIDISMFPAPKAGIKRSIIQVPEKGEEMDFQIEFFVGKEMEVDCNIHNMIGNIKETELQGWGYTFYEVASDSGIISTRMECIEPKKEKKFISIPSLHTRYNSKLPVVIYHPENLEVRYRIWSADSTMKNATN